MVLPGLAMGFGNDTNFLCIVEIHKPAIWAVEVDSGDIRCAGVAAGEKRNRNFNNWPFSFPFPQGPWWEMGRSYE